LLEARPWCINLFPLSFGGHEGGQGTYYLHDSHGMIKKELGPDSIFHL